MARKETKSDISYFPLDVKFNDSMNLYIAETGLIGLGVMIRLWQKIYSGRGYYTDWNTDIALLYSQTINIPADDDINRYIEVALKRNIFNESIYHNHKILTSEGIQERYLEATDRRKEIKIKKDFLLIEVAKNKNVNIFEENGYIYLKKVNRYQQTKSDQIKQNEIILNEINGDSHLLNEFFEKKNIADDEKDILKIYSHYFQPPKESYEQEFSDMLKIYKKAKDKFNVTAALDITKSAIGVRNPLAYIKKVCEDMDLNPNKYDGDY